MNKTEDCIFCKGQRLINKAMDVLEQVPEIDSWYFDDNISEAFNLLDDAYVNWKHPCTKEDDVSVEFTEEERNAIDKFIENTPYSLQGPLQREWLDAHTKVPCPVCGQNMDYDKEEEADKYYCHTTTRRCPILSIQRSSTATDRQLSEALNKVRE